MIVRPQLVYEEFTEWSSIPVTDVNKAFKMLFTLNVRKGCTGGSVHYSSDLGHLGDLELIEHLSGLYLEVPPAPWKNGHTYTISISDTSISAGSLGDNEVSAIGDTCSMTYQPPSGHTEYVFSVAAKCLTEDDNGDCTSVQPANGSVSDWSSVFMVEEKFPKENFRVNREMRDEILVYESIFSKFWSKMGSKCRENSSHFAPAGATASFTRQKSSNRRLG